MLRGLPLHVSPPSVPGSATLSTTECDSLLREAIAPAEARVLPASLVHVLVMPVLALATPILRDHPGPFWFVSGLYVVLAVLRVTLLRHVRRHNLPPTARRFLYFAAPMVASGLLWSTFTAAVTSWYGDHWLTLLMYLLVLFFAQTTVLFYNPLRTTTVSYFLGLVVPATLGAFLVELSARPIIVSVSALLVLQNLPSIQRLHTAYWAFAVNRTLLERARAQSERASAAKSEFLAAVSHEVRTPLSGIIGLVSLFELDESTQLSDEAKSHMDAIGVSAHSLLSLVDDLLDTARIEAGAVRLVPRPFSPRTLATEVTALFHGRAHQLHLDLTLEIDESAPVLATQDEDRCRQILQNLVTNALKFTEQGTVTVRLRATGDAGDHILFEVEDSGPGIAVEHQERIFERFAQGDELSRRQRGGAGLGLSICRDLARRMGGDIEVESSLGRGSVFRLKLPVHFAPAAREDDLLPPSSATEPTGSERPLEFLVVDDDPINRRYASTLLIAMGFRVREAENGAMAWATLQSSLPAAILLDCQMPEMDGFELCARIRAAGTPLAELPVVAMTANTSPATRARCVEVGMTEVLMKPLRPAELERSVTSKFGQDRRLQGGERRGASRSLNADACPADLGCTISRSS